MAMFNKIFASTKRKSQTNNGPHHQNTISPFSFSDEQTRIVLFRECDLRGTKLLFDSDAFTQMPNMPQKSSNKPSGNTKPNQSDGVVYEIGEGVSYRYSRQLKQKVDENILSEMIFGSVALALRGTTFKVHWLQDRIMISQVFLAPVQQLSPAGRHSQTTRLNIASNVVEDASTSSSVNSLSLSICVKSDMALSHPLDVPEDTVGSTEVKNTSTQQCSTGDSGYSGTDPWTATSTTSSRVSNRSSLASVFSDLDIGHHNGRKHSIDSMAGTGGPIPDGSSGNIQRRISRHMSTSMENRFTYPDLVGQLGEYCMSTQNVSVNELSTPRIRRNSEIVAPERTTAPDIRKRKAVSGDVLATSSRRTSARRPRLGIAVMFTLNKSHTKEMKLFCSEHMLMLEGMINRLRMAVEMAYISRQKFLQIMLSAFHETSSWLCDLFTAPRIKYPIWISLSTGFVHNAVQLAANFMKDLNTLMNQLDTKETNFFISRLLTAVLTCHLGWVNTVAPICVQKQVKQDGVSVETLVNKERIRLSEISKLHPYNALWAQLGDLHGAVGTPLRIAKTVVYGTDAHHKIVERILNILTYFIRCGEIKRLEMLKRIDSRSVGAIIDESNKNSLTNHVEHESKEATSKMMRRSNTQKSNLALMDQQEYSSASSSSSNIPFAMDSDSSLVVKGRFQVSTSIDVTDSSSTTHETEEEGVVFVLGGDNEELVGLTTKDLAQDSANGAIKKKQTCSKTHKHKNHSGVKFNFEKYPQIAKNYMRNKNLEMNNYEFFEKGLKMELQWKLNYDQNQSKTKTCTDPDDDPECECCQAMGAVYLQTPSNASELEFSSDDPLQEQHTSTPRIIISEATTSSTKLPLTYYPLDETREVNIVRHDTPQMNLIELPFKSNQTSATQAIDLTLTSPSENMNAKSEKLLPGFTPSLFVGMSNHFISDMILQGIISGRNDQKWEEALRQDLLYAAKCISLEQVPIENVAIVANIDKWDVRLLSSNSSYLASTATNKSFGIVGMSQLVSTLLETVQCMYQSGASAFQCMSLIESKLQEIYLQSETLSEFLLETEFCSLSMLTNTLELSDNDIPLLLAIASIHSPQVTKKYGVSTR